MIVNLSTLLVNVEMIVITSPRLAGFSNGELFVSESVQEDPITHTLFIVTGKSFSHKLFSEKRQYFKYQGFISTFL